MHEEPLRRPSPAASILGFLLAVRRQPCPPDMNEQDFRDREYVQLLVELYRVAMGDPP